MKKKPTATMYLVWRRVSGDTSELIGLFDTESAMNDYYELAMKRVDPKELHWTEVPVGWSYYS
ncbi:hypothetical protein [Brevibacterium oceani]|uniref:hypothetical protein n=1 Tax=Brevibacterium oceani TaxID=358099 RepID=UPI0015E6C81E|nr:hypothetical protein [Brevibacterium oceani]